MSRIESQFNDTFKAWGIVLPPDAVAEKRRGRISSCGWFILYLFGCDERGDYLDYYAVHRMTNDRHVRLYADGGKVGLPTILPSRPSSTNRKKDDQLEAAFLAENRRIGDLLREKGFDLLAE